MIETVKIYCKELEALQARINFDTHTMAACLGVSLDDYQRYLSGSYKIPAHVKRAAFELDVIDREFLLGNGYSESQ